MKLLITFITAATLFTAACEDPAANKTKATVSEPTANANANSTNQNSTEAPAKGESLAVDPSNSTIAFTGSKVTGQHEGGFKIFTGKIDLVNGKAEASSVSVDIETASIFANDDKLTEHLKTPDFFDVAKFPKTTFKSTKISPDAAGGANAYSVTGDFQIHGVTKSITFPATITISPEEVTVNSEFSINRKDFGIVYAGKADDLIRDDVVIRLNLKTPRKK